MIFYTFVARMTKKINIIGFGLVGCILAYLLAKKRNIQITIFDANLASSSKVAAGIFNPITGKRMVKTWLADEIFPFLHQVYSEIEVDFSIHFLHKTPIFKPFHDLAEQNYWMGKSAEIEYKNWIEIISESDTTNIDCPYGGLKINHSGWVDINQFLEKSKQIFKDNIKSELFDPKNHIGEINIFCEGAHAAQNPLWKDLNWQLNKGEILDIEIEDYNTNYIVNKSVFILQTNHYQRVGSTYHHHDLEPKITQNGIAELEQKLTTFLKSPYQIKDIKFGIRPATKDRRPFVFEHKTQKNNFIINGFGSKAVSLAPYFVSQLVEKLNLD